MPLASNHADVSALAVRPHVQDVDELGCVTPRREAFGHRLAELGVAGRTVVGLRSHGFGAGCVRSDALVNLVELLANVGLAFLVVMVHSNDEVMRRPHALIVGVVAVTKQELAARSRMCSDAPTPGLVTVVFLDELIHTGADGSEDAELGEIGPEPDQNP
jgi:hypothetical protein